MSEAATHEAIEAIARNSYGRLIAFLASRSGDVAAAEDALSEAFVAALEVAVLRAVNGCGSGTMTVSSLSLTIAGFK